MMEPPGLIGTLKSNNKTSPWLLETWGQWRVGEFQTIEEADAKLILIGQCHAKDHQLKSGFHQALRTGQLELITRWPGSYLAIVVQKNILTAFCDLAGQYPLYYCSINNRTIIGTQPRPTILAASGKAEPDLLTLAAQIFCPSTPILTENRSVFSGLSRIGGGQALQVAPDGNCTSWTYETPSLDSAASFSDAAESLRAALQTAVQLRAETTSRLSSDFSGGFDSTSIAFLAAQQRSSSLPIFTYHQPRAPAEDLVYAERYASLNSHFQHKIICGTNETLTYQNLEQSTATSLPHSCTVIQTRTRTQFQQIASTGADIHLSGEGADALLVESPGYLADLVQPGSLGQFFRDSYTIARRQRSSPSAVLKQSTKLSRTSINQALHSLADQLTNPVERSIKWLDAIVWWPPSGAEGGWLTRQMQRQLVELICDKAIKPIETGGLGIGNYTALNEVRSGGAIQRQLDEQARDFGFWAQAPFLDNDVIRACLSIPTFQRTDPSVVKPLLAKALSGIVPEVVFSRKTKGDYSGENYQGVRRAAGELQNRIANLRLADLGVVEPAPIQASLRRAVDGLSAPFPTLNRLLGTELWLQGEQR